MVAVVTRVLFICSGNRDSSPTAEQVFSSWPGIEVDSAGTRPDADVRVSAEHIEWADVVFVMEARHRTALLGTFPNEMKDMRMICLDIRDDYEFMAPDLILVLEQKVGRHLQA